MESGEAVIIIMIKKGNKHLKKQSLSLSAKEPASSKTIQTSFKTRNTTSDVPHTTAVVSIKYFNETKSTVFTDSSFSDGTDMEESVGNKYN